MRTTKLRQCDVSHYFWLDGFKHKGRVIYFKIDMFYPSTYSFKTDLNMGVDSNGSQQGIKKTIYDAEKRELGLIPTILQKHLHPTSRRTIHPFFKISKYLMKPIKSSSKKPKRKEGFFLRYINTIINEIQEVEYLEEDEEDFLFI